MPKKPINEGVKASEKAQEIRIGEKSDEEGLFSSSSDEEDTEDEDLEDFEI
ncbi:MAG: hypothetical protein V1886_01405 [archaeon]